MRGCSDGFQPRSSSEAQLLGPASFITNLRKLIGPGLGRSSEDKGVSLPQERHQYEEPQWMDNDEGGRGLRSPSRTQGKRLESTPGP